MTERPFEALGLSADADRAYPLLVATRGVTSAGLARQMRVPHARAHAACRELAARDLIRLGRDGRWYPVPPQTAFRPLLSRAQEQLRLGMELLDRLDVEYQRVHEGHRAEELVQVVEGRVAVRRKVAELHAAARFEVTSFLPGPDGPATVAAPVRQRVVLERALLEEPGAALDPSVQARVTDRLPVRLSIADRELALLPLAADARSADPVVLLVRPSGLLDALVALFESVWAAAVPLGPRRADPESPRGALHPRILAMLVSGSTDAAMARSLGVAVRTVQRHIAAMQREAGVDNRVQLVWHAARHGWLDDDPH